jgi:hypothetical protein
MLGRAPEESSTHQKVSEYSHSRGKRVIGIPLPPRCHIISSSSSSKNIGIIYKIKPGFSECSGTDLLVITVICCT